MSETNTSTDASSAAASPTGNTTVDQVTASQVKIAAAEDSKPKSYEVLSPVQHNGKMHTVGATIKLIEEEAEHLIAAGIIRLKKAVAAAQNAL